MPAKAIFCKKQAAPAYGLVLLAFLFACCWSGPCLAQVMRFQLQVEEYFAVSGVRPIAPAHSEAGKGWLSLGDTEEGSSGHFTVGAAENTWIHVSAEAPEALVLDAGNRLPFQLELSYHHHNPEDTLPEVIPFMDHSAAFPLSGKGLLVGQMENAILPLQSRVLLHPTVYVGQVARGVYRGRILFRVEYL